MLMIVTVRLSLILGTFKGLGGPGSFSLIRQTSSRVLECWSNPGIGCSLSYHDRHHLPLDPGYPSILSFKPLCGCFPLIPRPVPFFDVIKHNIDDWRLCTPTRFCFHHRTTPEYQKTLGFYSWPCGGLANGEW